MYLCKPFVLHLISCIFYHLNNKVSKCNEKKIKEKKCRFCIFFSQKIIIVFVTSHTTRQFDIISLFYYVRITKLVISRMQKVPNLVSNLSRTLIENKFGILKNLV